MREIPLTKGLVALVDDADFEFLSQWNWGAAESRKTHYAVRQERRIGRRRVRCLMHRVILNAPQGVQVDHISGDGLDNRRSNLRLATREQNQANHGPLITNKSGLKGVSWDRRKQRWQADITAGGHHRHLGYFDDKEQAGQAYDSAARKLHGDFAWLNFPEVGS